MLLAPLNDKKFKIEHLLSSTSNLEDIKSFFVAKNTGKGLENYLKTLAEAEEHDRSNRTYLVRDKETNEIAAYFSLHTGAFTLKAPEQSEEDAEKYTVPSVELSNFAVNSAYRERHPEIKGLGELVFRRFIIPTVNYGAELFGIQAIHIYALPQDELLEHYSTFEFSRLPPEMEAYIHNHIKPAYDEGCIFMYQIL
ncbi:MAG: hypothetical protein K5751_04900 [Treponemataceae bacterium]|nr:hypothetical protein [Treponemataceae bacterium]